MSFAAAVDHLYALGLELVPAPSPVSTPAVAGDPAPPGAAYPAAPPRRKFDIEHMRILAAALGDPQKQFPAVLIAGTNGKGSTAATLASILAAAGYRTGLYTSPHLSRVTERIRTSQNFHSEQPCLSEQNRESKRPRKSEHNREPKQSCKSEQHCHSERSEESPHFAQDAPLFSSRSEAEGSVPVSPMSPATASFPEIPEETFARLYFRVDEAARRLVSTGQLPHHPSFFESLTALAFLYFAEQRLDIAILEVGLGGRLDATNIVEPILSILTDIALDHQDYLGNTIAEIAREKAGILRAGGTLITLPQHPEANQAIGEAAVALNVRGINAAEFLPARSPSHALRSSSRLVAQSFSAESPAENHAEAEEPLPAGKEISNSSTRSSSGLQPAGGHPEMIGASAPGSLSKAPTRAFSPASKATSPLSPNHYDLILDGELLNIRSPLAGQHQQRNIALAIAAAIELRNQKGYVSKSAPLELGPLNRKPLYNIPNSAIEAGIANTFWPGRLEFFPPNLMFDIAHNPAGAWTLRAAIATLPELTPRTLIFSCLRDKDLTQMTQILFPLFDSSSDRQQDHIVLAPIDNPRAASLADLLAAAGALSVPAHPAHNPTEALALARKLTPDGGLILATGSIYLIGALRDAVLPQ